MSRVLEQWNALLIFFSKSEYLLESVKVDGASQIYKTLLNWGTRHMLFLNYILGKVDKMNIEFQAKYFRLSTLYSLISDEYRSILSIYYYLFVYYE